MIHKQQFPLQREYSWLSIEKNMNLEQHESRVIGNVGGK